MGTVTFSRSDEYGSLAAFRADRNNHRIAKGGHYDWDGKGKRYAWRVSAVRRLAQPVPQPGGKGTTGFTKNRPYTVSFAETASIVGLRRGEGASAAVPSGREGRRVSTGKRSTPASRGSAASASAPKARMRLEIPEVSLREGLFFDPQQGAWCGMHALNNYCLNGPLVQQQDCRDAARLVARRLTDARAGDVEPISNHLDPLTGWLSIDVINVLGQANLGLHVEAARASFPDGLRGQQFGAALVNWNQRHWTVLQRDPSGDGWMHTNNIEGVAPRYGRKGASPTKRFRRCSRTSGGMQEVWRCTRSRELWAPRGDSTWKGKDGAPWRPLKVRKCRAMPPPGRRPNLTRLAW